MKSFVIRAETGEYVPFPPQNGSTFSLEEIRTAIGGGYIEIVQLRTKHQLLVCDEEGKLKGLPPNPWADLYASLDITGDCLAGDVLVCEMGMIE